MSKTIKDDEIIEINICAFSSAISEVKSLDRFSGNKDGTDMLTVACMTNAIYQDLIGYLDDENRDKLVKYRKLKKDF